MSIVNAQALSQHAGRVAHLRAQLAEAEKRLALLPKPSETPDDPAYVNLKGHRKNLDRDIDKGLALIKAEESVQRLRGMIVSAIKRAPAPVTMEDLSDARAIRTVNGWQKVAKVNAKSVSVETGYSWTDRVAVDKVLEVAA